MTMNSRAIALVRLYLRESRPTATGLQHQQRRFYFFPPTSWTEWELRRRRQQQRENREPRFVPVTLRNAGDDVVDGRQSTRRSSRGSSERRIQSRPPPTSGSSHRRPQQSPTRSTNQQQTATIRTKTLATPSRFKRKRRRKPARSLTVPIDDYCHPDWFGVNGRPLTTKDASGRFVNPWASESSDGIQSLSTLLHWARGKMQKDWQAQGWRAFLPHTLPPPPSPQQSPLSKPLFHPKLVPVSSPSNHEKSASVSHRKQGRRRRNRQTSPSDAVGRVRCTWIGHSTCLFHQETTGIVILTDPVFSPRASPWPTASWIPIGVPRLVPPAFSVTSLPDVDLCVISHDHYDHLDSASVRDLRDCVKMWVVPVGIGSWLRDQGIAAAQIVELEWWESVLLSKQQAQQPHQNEREWRIQEIHSLRQAAPAASCTHHPAMDQPPTANEIWVTCCPAQHWSSRSFFDRNLRLWASFAIFLPQQTIFFAGDTALPKTFPLFELIADYIGRIDLATIPIGAYEPDYLNWDVHVDPRQAVEVHERLRARQSVAIHHGSFALGDEPLEEPAQVLRQVVSQTKVDFCDLPIGGSIEVPAVESKR